MTSTGMQRTAVNGDAVGEVEIYQSSDGSVRLDVRTDGDAVWLTGQQMGDLFGRDVRNWPTSQLSQNLRQLSKRAIAPSSVISSTTISK